MPATAGRVRMPANNRVHSSAALQTHGIWQSAIGYDPYAPNKDEGKSSGQQKSSAAAEPEAENTYASFQGLLALARITGTNADEARGACRKCGRVGHLTFQCRNFLSIKDDGKEKDPEAVDAAALPLLNKIKGVAANKLNGKNAGRSDDESEEEEESDDSDSDVDSEMERIIAERYGKKLATTGSKGKSSKKKKDDSEDDDSASDSDSGERRRRRRKRRGRSRRRRSGKKRSSYSSDDEDDGRRKKRKEKRRRKTESSDDDGDDDEERQRHHRKARREKRRRRSHYSDGSDSDVSDDSRRRRKQRSRKAAAPSDSEAASSDDSRAEERARKLKRSSRKHRDRIRGESS